MNGRVPSPPPSAAVAASALERHSDGGRAGGVVTLWGGGACAQLRKSVLSFFGARSTAHAAERRACLLEHSAEILFCFFKNRWNVCVVPSGLWVERRARWRWWRNMLSGRLLLDKCTSVRVNTGGEVTHLYMATCI